jgi:hypothetical protein
MEKGKSGNNFFHFINEIGHSIILIFLFLPCFVLAQNNNYFCNSSYEICTDLVTLKRPYTNGTNFSKNRAAGDVAGEVLTKSIKERYVGNGPMKPTLEALRVAMSGNAGKKASNEVVAIGNFRNEEVRNGLHNPRPGNKWLLALNDESAWYINEGEFNYINVRQGGYLGTVSRNGRLVSANGANKFPRSVVMKGAATSGRGGWPIFGYFVISGGVAAKNYFEERREKELESVQGAALAK